MNAPGISVFYGAMDKGTCIAEARAPVGSSVVLAKFEFLSSVRLLDFDVLTEPYVEGSHFDLDYGIRKGRVAFLGRLAREISRPVMPQDEAFEYLASQAVAEYLANKLDPRLDGVIFRSSQTGGTGRNLVLFNHACSVEPYDLPEGTDVTVCIRRADEDNDEDEDSDITVFETVRPDPPETASPTEAGGGIADFLNVFHTAVWNEDGREDDDDPPPYHHDPILRLDLASIGVFDIKGVQYKHVRQQVSRHRRTRDEQKIS